MAVTVVVTPPVSYTAKTCFCRCCAAAAPASSSSEASDAVSYRSRFSRFRCSCFLCAGTGPQRAALCRRCVRFHAVRPSTSIQLQAVFLDDRHLQGMGSAPLPSPRHASPGRPAPPCCAVHRRRSVRQDTAHNGCIMQSGCTCHGCAGRLHLSACFLRATFRLWNPVTKSLQQRPV